MIELAQYHKYHTKEWKVTQAERKEAYESTIAIWQEEKRVLEDCLYTCESAWYMSPFALLFCTHYHKASQAHTFAIQMLQVWHEQTQAEETIKLEPVHDLVAWYYKQLKTYPAENEKAMEWFASYQSIYPFTEAEKQLFMSHLAYPTHLIKLVKEHTEKKNQRKQTWQLQQVIWLMTNIETFIKKIRIQSSESA